mmetsp:Transcript_28369/g.94173  ORF Transcript_28369/g.94173 Transcript_28369/m.94173 type:complete len:204 (+) Transcript_28369:3663-4274(+)
MRRPKMAQNMTSMVTDQKMGRQPLTNPETSAHNPSNMLTRRTRRMSRASRIKRSTDIRATPDFSLVTSSMTRSTKEKDTQTTSRIIQPSCAMSFHFFEDTMTRMTTSLEKKTTKTIFIMSMKGVPSRTSSSVVNPSMTAFAMTMKPEITSNAKNFFKVLVSTSSRLRSRYSFSSMYMPKRNSSAWSASFVATLIRSFCLWRYK